MQQQPLAVAGNGRHPLDPFEVLRLQPLEIPDAAAVHHPHLPERDTRRIDGIVREAGDREDQRVVVPEQAADVPRRLSLEPHHELDHAEAVRPTVGQIPEEPEPRVRARPSSSPSTRPASPNSRRRVSR